MHRHAPERVAHGLEMRHSLLAREIAARDGDLHELAPGPGRPSDDLRLESEPRRPAAEVEHLPQRVNPKSALRVVHVPAALQADHQVGEVPSDPAGGGIVGPGVVAPAQDQRKRLPGGRRYEFGNLLRIQPPVGVQRDGVSEATLHRVAKTAQHRRRLAAIDWMREHAKVVCVRGDDFFQNAGRFICRAIVDDHHGQAYRPHSRQHVAQCRGVVGTWAARRWGENRPRRLPLRVEWIQSIVKSWNQT